MGKQKGQEGAISQVTRGSAPPPRAAAAEAALPPQQRSLPALAGSPSQGPPPARCAQVGADEILRGLQGEKGRGGRRRIIGGEGKGEGTYWEAQRRTEGKRVEKSQARGGAVDGAGCGLCFGEAGPLQSGRGVGRG